MLMPGFDKGVIEGVATTAANVDIGRSYLGKMTGMSYLKRGIEGILPGFTDVSTSLYLGIGAAALSYGGYGQNFLKRSAEGNLTSLDDFASKLIPQFIKDRVGLVSNVGGGGVRIPLTKKQIRGSELYDVLAPLKSGGEFSEDFIKYNPLAKHLSSISETSSEFIDYQKRLSDILDGKGKADLDKHQIKNLMNFFNDK